MICCFSFIIIICEISYKFLSQMFSKPALWVHRIIQTCANGHKMYRNVWTLVLVFLSKSVHVRCSNFFCQASSVRKDQNCLQTLYFNVKFQGNQTKYYNKCVSFPFVVFCLSCLWYYMSYITSDLDCVQDMSCKCVSRVNEIYVSC